MTFKKSISRRKPVTVLPCKKLPNGVHNFVYVYDGQLGLMVEKCKKCSKLTGYRKDPYD
jgi:hypothetical protein